MSDLVAFFAVLSKPICTAEYPSLSPLTWVTVQGPAAMTVTGTTPVSSYRWVILIFFPRMNFISFVTKNHDGILERLLKLKDTITVSSACPVLRGDYSKVL